MHPTNIRVSIVQLRNNIIAIKKHIKSHVKICLPVKANAYGHGLIGVAQHTYDLVDYFAVSCLDEGYLLRKNSITKPILVFGAFDEDQIIDLILNNLEITISSLYKAQLVSIFAEKLGKKCKIHIKIDTGMRRVGLRPESLDALINFVKTSQFIELVGVYSHFASSDDIATDFTLEQINVFDGVVKKLKLEYPNLIVHLANSGGVCYYPTSHYDMVRPGLLSYGYFPSVIVEHGVLSEIKPCFELITKVVYFKTVFKDNGISYNHTYMTSSQTRIATIPIGYGDGYRRALSNKAVVLIRGNYYPVVGSICMDLSMIDLGCNGESYVGDEVVLIGRQEDLEIKLSDLASLMETIVYEVLVGFNERIPRIYITEKKNYVWTNL